MNIDLLRDLLVESIPVPTPVEKPGPRQCCADAGVVLTCDGEIDFWECWICGRRWEAPCR